MLRPGKRKASTSKKSDTGSIEITFCVESGKTYRPFTDPKRIETNDAKKRCTDDVRAQVKGIPQGYLGVMNTREVSRSADAMNQWLAPSSPSSRLDSPSGTSETQQSVFSFDTPSNQPIKQEEDTNHPSEQAITDDSDVKPPFQRTLEVPTPNQNWHYPSVPYTVTSPYPSTASQDPTSASREPFSSLHLPTTSSSMQNDEHCGQEAEGPQLPDLGDGDVKNAALEYGMYHFSDSTSFGSPESTCTIESFESTTSSSMSMPETTEFLYKGSPFDDHDGSLVPQSLDVNPNLLSPTEFDYHFSINPSDITRDSPFLDQIGTTMDLRDSLLSEAQKIAQKMTLNAIDLKYLSEDQDEIFQRNIFKSGADPCVNLASICSD